MNNETIDEATGELIVEAEAGMMIPVREAEAGAGTAIQVSPDYKPTTLLDYSALMLAARAHPRDMNLAIKQAEAIVTMNETTAMECFYALPRGGSKITGESIGMAETLAACYGNMSITTDKIEVLREEGVVQVHGFIMDCETGLTYSTIVRRGIKYGPNHKTKAGQLFDDDMINMTTGAAVSILYRSLVLRIIPRPIRKHIYERALSVATGGGKTFTERQRKCVEHWEEEMGIDKSKLLLHLGYTEVKDLNIQDFEYLLGIENAIKTGDIKVEEVFKKDLVIPPKPGEKPKDLNAVTADLKAKAETPAPPKAPEEPEMPEPALTPEQDKERQVAAETPEPAPVAPEPEPAPDAPKKPVAASTSEPEQAPGPPDPPAVEDVGMPGAPIPRPKS